MTVDPTMARAHFVIVCLTRVWQPLFFHFFVTKRSSLPCKLGKPLWSATTWMYKYTFVSTLQNANNFFITFIVPYHIIVQFTNSSEYIHLVWHCILIISGDILHIPSVVFTDVLVYCIGRTIYQAL